MVHPTAPFLQHATHTTDTPPPVMHAPVRMAASARRTERYRTLPHPNTIRVWPNIDPDPRARGPATGTVSCNGPEARRADANVYSARDVQLRIREVLYIRVATHFEHIVHTAVRRGWPPVPQFGGLHPHAYPQIHKQPRRR